MLIGFGSFKIVLADDPIGNSIPFNPGFEHVIVLKFVASDATDEIPLPPRNIFLFTVGVDDDFSVFDPYFGVLARYMRFGLMSAFKHDDRFASFSILWDPRSSPSYSSKLSSSSNDLSSEDCLEICPLTDSGSFLMFKSLIEGKSDPLVVEDTNALFSMSLSSLESIFSPGPAIQLDDVTEEGGDESSISKSKEDAVFKDASDVSELVGFVANFRLLLNEPVIESKILEL